ncbi:MAG: thrombospondin type 3 repeat-containing protein [Sandaracinaceae bacterium]
MRPAALAGLACLVLMMSSLAEAQDPDSAEFNLMRYTPAPGPLNYGQVDGAQTPGHLMGSAGLVLDYAHRPFVLWNADCADDGSCTVGDERATLVEYIAAAHVMGTLQLFDRLQIGLVVPVALMNGDGFSGPMTGRNPVVIPGGQSVALADPRLTLKGRFLTESGFSLSASAFVTAPTGARATARSQAFLGDDLPMFGGQLIGELSQSGFRISGNVGGTWREEVTLLSTVVGPQLTYGVGIGYDITTLVGIFGEFVGASTFTSQIDEHSLEWRAGGTIRVDDFQFQLAGGTGLPPFGVGTPIFRAIGGVQWAPIRLDSDGDGIEDADDSCPSEREDVDGYEDEDGCPEADNDGDGHDDASDPCPDEAEDMDGFEDTDGCPDTDNDGDGIHDGYDSCPDQAEDMDGDRDEDGCPDDDTDRDGIDDAQDQCPEQAEDFDGFGDEDGCPEEDFDNDQVPDDQDACPDEAEDLDGFEDQDGCPEEGTAAPAEHRHSRGR